MKDKKWLAPKDKEFKNINTSKLKIYRFVQIEIFLKIEEEIETDRNR